MCVPFCQQTDVYRSPSHCHDYKQLQSCPESLSWGQIKTKGDIKDIPYIGQP